jgi:hypothetical protein
MTPSGRDRVENLLLDGGDGDLMDGGDGDLLVDGLRRGGGDGNLPEVVDNDGLGAVFSIAPWSGEDAKEMNRLVGAAARLLP